MIASTGFPAPFVAFGASQGAANPKQAGDARPSVSAPVPSGGPAALSSKELDELSAARKERAEEMLQEIDATGSRPGESGQQVSIVV